MLKAYFLSCPCIYYVYFLVAIFFFYYYHYHFFFTIIITVIVVIICLVGALWNWSTKKVYLEYFMDFFFKNLYGKYFLFIFMSFDISC